jgi:type IV pilus assembly protein PilM
VIATLKDMFSQTKLGLGVELTPERINIAQLQKLKTGAKLNALVSVPVPEGAIQDGRIMDATAIADAIRQGLSEKKIKLKQAASAVPVGEAVIRLIKLPAELDDFELRDMVLNQEAALYLPFPREEADVDFQKLGTTIDEDGIERVEILLVATQKETTQSYMSVFSQAGLQLSVLEVSSFALMRSIRNQLQHFGIGETVALVDIEFDGTEISIVMDGIPQFNRKIPIGTHQMQDAISRAMNLPSSMGVDLLSTMTVPVGPVDSGVGATNPSAAAILRVLGDLSDELRRSIDFYLNQGDNMEISQILLAGPGAGLGQIDDFFTQRLNLTTTLVDPVESLAVQVPAEISPERRPGLGVVMGLGLRGV